MRRVAALLLAILFSFPLTAAAQTIQRDVIDAIGDQPFITPPGDAQSIIMDVVGTFEGELSVTTTFTGSQSDNRTWKVTNLETGAQITSITAPGSYRLSNPGYPVIRIVPLGWTSGTANLEWRRGGQVSESTGSGGGVAGVVQVETPNGDSMANDTLNAIRAEIVGGAGAGGTSQDDNTALAAVTAFACLFDTTPPSITDGFVGVPRCDSSRYLYTVFPSAQAVTASQTGTWTFRLFDQNGNGINSTTNALHTLIQNSSIAVTGSFLTDGQLRATAVPVSGPITDAQLRATAVPVSGPLTDTQLRATAIPVSQNGTWSVRGQDGAGNAITSTLAGSRRPWDMQLFKSDGNPVSYIDDVLADGNTDVGTQDLPITGIALPAPGGAVIGGTPTNPLRTDPTGTTTQPMGGNVASGGTDSGNPVKTGGVAVNSISTPALLADGQRSNHVVGLDKVAIYRPHANLEDLVRGRQAITDGLSTSVISAAGSGLKIYITSVACSNTSATDLEIDIRDGTAGSVIATIPCPAGGGIYNPPTPIPGFTANTAVAVDPSAAATTVTVTLLGFKSRI